jgi:hypothetical protein
LAPLAEQGVTATGRVAEQPIQVVGPDGQPMGWRRMRVLLHKPTRDGDEQISRWTNLPAAVPAETVARLYLKRWRIGVSGQGPITQSVQVRPRLIDSSLVAWEAPWRESKTVKPSDLVHLGCTATH